MFWMRLQQRGPLNAQSWLLWLCSNLVVYSPNGERICTLVHVSFLYPSSMRLLIDLFVANPGNTTFWCPLRLATDVRAVKATKTLTHPELFTFVTHTLGFGDIKHWGCNRLQLDFQLGFRWGMGSVCARLDTKIRVFVTHWHAYPAQVLPNSTPFRASLWWSWFGRFLSNRYDSICACARGLHVSTPFCLSPHRSQCFPRRHP